MNGRQWKSPGALHRTSDLTRRQWLATAAAAGPAVYGLSSLPAAGAQESAKRRPRVAAIFTVLRFRSHAYNILENFLGPYLFNGQLIDPGVDVVSFYADQFPDDDMAREVARRFNVPLYKSIDEALCLGGKRLEVDAVLSIAEHGDYPFNERGQQLYPRKAFFDQSLAVMKRSGRYVPFFNDKHLSYRWDWARQMFDASRANGFPLLAGSSVPLAQRMPPLDLPADSTLDEAIAIHGGGLETYDFHGLEVLQSFVEARRGGETGIESVELLIGEAYRQAVKAGRWSQVLVDAAMKAEKQMGVRRQARPRIGVYQPGSIPKPSGNSKRPPRPEGPHAIIVKYRDGLQATVLKVGSSGDRWNFACQVRGESKPRATALFNSPWGNRGLFKALSQSIQHLFKHGSEPYPAERTLLTTGAVEATMRSYERGEAVDTPHLQVAYRPVDWSRHRERGGTWQRITVDTPQPTRFAPRSWDQLK